MSNKIPPPVFGGDKTYERWKGEISAWDLVSTVEKKAKAITVALSFPEGSDVRDKVFSEIKIDDLNKDEGLKTLLDSLDKWYKKDELSAAYESWTRFDTYKKEKQDNMEKYILEFDKRSKALSRHNVVIPKCILAFKLLDSAGLDVKEKQIVLTAVTFSEPDTMYDSMQLALKKFFGSQEVLSLAAGAAGDSSGGAAAVVVKSEPVYTAEEVNFTNRGRGRYRPRGSQVRSGYTYGGNSSKGGIQRKNPPDSQGNPRKCFVCGSQFHFASSCPKNVYMNSVDEVENKSECYIANIKGSSEMEALMVESFNYAILDSACTSTVCGTDWLQSYLQTLSEEEMEKIEEEDSKSKFQ